MAVRSKVKSTPSREEAGHAEVWQVPFQHPWPVFKACSPIMTLWLRTPDHQTVCEGSFPLVVSPREQELFLLPGSGKQQMGYLQGAMEVVWGKIYLVKWAGERTKRTGCAVCVELLQ